MQYIAHHILRSCPLPQARWLQTACAHIPAAAAAVRNMTGPIAVASQFQMQEMLVRYNSVTCV